MTNLSRTRKRYLCENFFRFTALGACVIVFVFLGILFIGIVANGLSGFFKTEILLDIDFNPEWVQFDAQHQRITHFDYNKLILSGLRKPLSEAQSSGVPHPFNHKEQTVHHQEHHQEQEQARLVQLISPSARKTLYLFIKQHPDYIRTTQSLWLAASDEVDIYLKDPKNYLKNLQNKKNEPTEKANLSEENHLFAEGIQPNWINILKQKNLIRRRINCHFFLAADSREPGTAGILGALIGSFYLMLVTLAISFPIGIAAAIYLEEFAPKKSWSHFIEVSISNLAAVPSIVFGLLGLSVFINTLNLPRSSVLVGGMTLSFMTLPTMIIAARSALRQVPNTIRDAARGLGASPIQVTFHHVVPLALPGILTGTIISMARALGETAPLLMVGMMAFLADFPADPMDTATALPVQIFTWARNPEPGFIANAAAAILVLLIFMGMMNLGAIFLRHRFEHKW
jgi:phosphate transport system permease protein